MEQKNSEIILEKLIIYDSIRLHLLFPTMINAALYLVSIKSYSKKIPISIHLTRTQANEIGLIEILLL